MIRSDINTYHDSLPRKMADSKYDIDTYLNPFTPRNPLHHLPYAIAHFLGVRSSRYPQFQKQPHILLVWLWCFLGAFLGVALIEAVYQNLPLLDGKHVPVVIASFGAAAILEYNTIESPLAQPRNLVFGHFLAAVVGVSITKLFHLLPEARFHTLRWLAGALSVGTASVVMAMTKTVHPPAGATALLCATSADVTELGWWTLALILLACMLMLVSALILNNIFRRFPVYWWTPADLKEAHKKRWSSDNDQNDVEKASQAVRDTEEVSVKKLSSSTESASTVSPSHQELAGTTISSTTSRTKQDLQLKRAINHEIVIRHDHIVIPDWMEVDDWETGVLQVLQERLRDRTEDVPPLNG